MNPPPGSPTHLPVVGALLRHGGEVVVVVVGDRDSSPGKLRDHALGVRSSAAVHMHDLAACQPAEFSPAVAWGPGDLMPPSFHRLTRVNRSVITVARGLEDEAQ